MGRIKAFAISPAHLDAQRPLNDAVVCPLFICCPSTLVGWLFWKMVHCLHFTATTGGESDDGATNNPSRKTAPFFYSSLASILGLLQSVIAEWCGGLFFFFLFFFFLSG
ncbi:hypothetical protein F4775DRAFT_553387 [Biscogniauxia sp. FL1348]|nr:hypothetical protein F4775DRAFT_553387 [Biscogniauxia sp. FL1348]